MKIIYHICRQIFRIAYKMFDSLNRALLYVEKDTVLFILTENLFYLGWPDTADQHFGSALWKKFTMLRFMLDLKTHFI